MTNGDEIHQKTAKFDVNQEQLGPRSDMLAVKTSDLSLNFCDFWSLRAIQDTFN